jgi:hypothetical protein
VTTLIRPNSELVFGAWLSSVAGLSPSMVATQLPSDLAAWQKSGFVTYVVNGGSPSIYTPLRSPVFGVDCWAAAKGSSKPQWFMANSLAEKIRQGCNADNAQRWLTMPTGYEQARVATAYLLSEPQRVYDDAGNLARYRMNVQANWVAAT